MTAQPAFAERKLVMMGGGGEPEGSTTIFDTALGNLSQYMGKSNWGEVTLNFNGGHGTTESILQNQFTTNNKNSFTEETWKHTIENYEAQLKSGQLKEGDQLLVMIDTHGGLSRDYQNETTHPIAIGRTRSSLDLNNLNGSTQVSMDDLKNLTTLAKEKGIKLGIIDLSCHSGNSLALANENTCVISATGPNHFAYTDFAENFMANMKDGKSLEDVFLETRRSSSNKAFPMISTSEGESIKRELYQGLTPYLYDTYKVSEASSKLSTYLEASTDANRCVRQNEYEKLQKKISDLEKSSNLTIKTIIPEITSIKEYLKTYKEKQDQYIALLSSLKPKGFELREKFIGKSTVGKKNSSISAEYSWQELVETDFDSLIKNLYSSLNNRNTSSTNIKPMSELEVRTLVDLYIKANTKKRSILANNPDLNNSNYKTKFEEQLNLLGDTNLLAYKIGHEEKKIYDVMYRNLRQENNQKNPCRDFLL
ncbi:MAG: hypothetical protein PHY93_19005 [Bacteriovorax sp.]|nr:hypothetical protein [Bacteriovorax sp.]